MQPIRHYVFALVSFLLLWWIVGPQPAIWVAAAFCAYLFVKSLGDIVLERVKFRLNRALRTADYENIWVFRIGSVLIWGSLGIVILATILLFQNFGWISAIGLVILVFGYGYLRETDGERWHRLAGKSRSSLIQLVQENLAGKLTKEQLDIRAQLIFRNELPSETFYIPSLSTHFLSEESIKTNEYRGYLELIERHLSRVERFPPFSDLRKTVRGKLGLDPNR